MIQPMRDCQCIVLDRPLVFARAQPDRCAQEIGRSEVGFAGDGGIDERQRVADIPLRKIALGTVEIVEIRPARRHAYCCQHGNQRAQNPLHSPAPHLSAVGKCTTVWEVGR